MIFQKKPFIALLGLLAFLFLSNLSFAKENAVDSFVKGKQLFDEFKYFEATTFLRKAIDLNPYYLKAKLLLGDSYLKLKNYNKAFEIYLSCEKQNPNDPKVLLKLAQVKIAQGKSKKDLLGARFYINKAYSLKPRDPDIIASYGEYYFKIDQYKKAMEFYNKLAINVPSIPIHINKAKVYQKWGQTEKSLKELELAETIDSNNFNLLLAFGQHYSHLKEFDKATHYFMAALKVNPESEDPLIELVTLYMSKQDFATASIYISQLIEKKKTNPLLYYYLGSCYEALGEFEKAVDVLMAGIEYDYGNEFLRIKAEEITLNHLPLGSPVRKKFSTYYNQKAKEIISSGRSDNAFFYLKRSLRVNPLSVPIREKLANLYRDKGFIYEYLRILKTGLFLEPNNNKIKDLYTLNQKFTRPTLEAQENLSPFPQIPLSPVFSIDSVVLNPNSPYLFFSDELKELTLEALLNTHSINAFIRDEDNSEKISDFSIRIVAIPTKSSIKLKAEITYVKTGSIYKTINVSAYGNDHITSAIQDFVASLVKSTPLIGKIIKIDGRTAIVNLGAGQGLKKGDKVDILNSPNAFDHIIYSNNTDKSVIASGYISEIGENISKIFFKPSNSVVFNMVQQNQSLIIKKMKSPSKKK